MHAPRRKRETSRTKRRGMVRSDHAVSQKTAKISVSPINPIQIGRNGIGMMALLAEGVLTAEELPVSVIGERICLGPARPEDDAAGASVSTSDISATMGQPRASTCRSSRLAMPASMGTPALLSMLQEGTSSSGLPLLPLLDPKPEA